MKAAWYERFGKADDVLIVGDRPEPHVGASEVLIQLQYSAVNPSDVKKRAGLNNPNLLANGPIIPHSDGAGIIEALGTGVSRARIGERVWTHNAQHQRLHGTAAEYIALPAELAIPLPAHVDFATGACLGIPAMTAHRSVAIAGAVAGKVLLITGGAGRVGHYAIQWAKLMGASVIATAGSAASREQCIAAGADHVIGHPSAASVAEILDYTGGRGVDQVIDGDFGVNLPFTAQVLRMGGHIATYASMSQPAPALPFYALMYHDISIHLVFVYEMPAAAKRQATADITQALERRQLLHRVAQCLPLNDIAIAHGLIESGKPRGCVVLDTR
ncbi:MAG: NADPH:quinone reductase [Porticoccaceae bacterium]